MDVIVVSGEEKSRAPFNLDRADQVFAPLVIVLWLVLYACEAGVEAILASFFMLGLARRPVKIATEKIPPALRARVMEGLWVLAALIALLALPLYG